MKTDRIWYKCDPDKNTECRKRRCKHNPLSRDQSCDLTSNPACSVDGVKYHYVKRIVTGHIKYELQPL